MQDLVCVLGQATAKSPKRRPRLGIVVYPQLQQELAAISTLLRPDLRIYPSDFHSEDMRRALAQAAADNVDVIIGGETSVNIAESLGLRSQLLICGEASIRQALREAQRIVYARELEQAQSLKFKTVIEHSHDGIVSLDAAGRVLLINPVARRMLRLKNDITHHPFKSILDLPHLERCLLLGASVVDEMATVEGRKLLFSAIPIHVAGAVHGAVITFQEPRAIAAKESKIRHEDAEMTAEHTFEDILGTSPAILTAIARARKFAPARQPVLIQGETGTGKELFAQAIHNAGPRSQEAFVAVNCGALPQSLLESELFGYEDGAFTGASRKGKPGLFEMAHLGTLFLDEIGEMDLRAQQRLLRVLETQRVLRISGTRNIRVDVRIIAATNANLWERVRKGRFRADLFYRLSVLVLPLPPLRQRPDDIELLARHFFAEAEDDINALPPRGQEALEVLRNHPWSGNVRELRYFIQRLRVTGPAHLDAPTLSRLLPPLHPQAAPSLQAPTPHADQEETDERSRIRAALEACHGHQGNAARLLQISRSTLFRKMRKLGLR
jgi:transcriptional regulator with PAS, ATPase and Fis domain